MYKELETSKRTHMCGTLRSKNKGNYVTVAVGFSGEEI